VRCNDETIYSNAGAGDFLRCHLLSAHRLSVPAGPFLFAGEPQKIQTGHPETLPGPSLFGLLKNLFVIGGVFL
jgi:hypothetical protein